MRTIALSLLTLVVACTTTSAATSPKLADTEWRFTAIDGAAPAGEATLSFQGDRLSASAGCNRMAGTWHSEGGKLFAGPLAATRMFCEGKMEQEHAVSALLGGAPQITETNGQMTLTSAGHSAVLERKR